MMYDFEKLFLLDDALEVYCMYRRIDFSIDEKAGSKHLERGTIRTIDSIDV